MNMHTAFTEGLLSRPPETPQGSSKDRSHWCISVIIHSHIWNFLCSCVDFKGSTDGICNKVSNKDLSTWWHCRVQGSWQQLLTAVLGHCRATKVKKRTMGSVSSRSESNDANVEMLMGNIAVCFNSTVMAQYWHLKKGVQKGLCKSCVRVIALNQVSFYNV